MSENQLEALAKQIGKDFGQIRPFAVVVDGSSPWEQSNLKADFKMVKIPCAIKNPVVAAQNITTGIIANPAFYLKKEEGFLSLHTLATNHANYYGNGKVEIHLMVSSIDV